jgi:DNA polymerase-1
MALPPRGTERVAVVVDPTPGSPAGGAVVGPRLAHCVPVDALAGLVAHLEAERSPRWTWWSASHDARPLAAARVLLARCWDIAEAHRLAVGGWAGSPQLAWAAAHELEPVGLPQPAVGDLFDFGVDDAQTAAPDSVVRTDGYLRPEAGSAAWPMDETRLLAWAQAALDCAARQEERLAGVAARAVATAHSESAAALLCVELERDGLPVDRETAQRLIEEAAGPRPTSEGHAGQVRAQRDAQVLRHVPGRESTDLRNPLQVRELLASVGVVVPNTRKWVLAPFRETHAVVDALLEWRKAERIATTYGHGWLAAHVGPDDRLRGAWTACDGSAGRMTAQNGLHNLPAALRPAIAAHPGHVFVRADLGQIEPRVLAAVSGDRAFAAATRADDLYAPVAAALGVERPTAKVAVLAAMYGQRSGAAGEALKRLERAYPTAMAYLDRAYAAGVRRDPLRTFGGRAIPLGQVLTGDAGSAPSGEASSREVMGREVMGREVMGGEVMGGEVTRRAGLDGPGPAGLDRDSGGPDTAARDAARGRFARNAVIQGAAAELFKAWAATVRATTRDLGAQIVLCLHDELLVHVPEGAAEQTMQRLVTALDDSARRWTGSTEVRFVADASIIERWSDAKESGRPVTGAEVSHAKT